MAELLPDTQKSQPPTKETRAKHRLVIRPNRLWHPITLERLKQSAKQSNCRLITDGLQDNCQPRTMVDGTENVMDFARHIHFAGQIDTPNRVSWHRRWNSTFPLAAQRQNRVSLTTQELMDETFTDRHTMRRSKHPVEMISKTRITMIRAMGL